MFGPKSHDQLESVETVRCSVIAQYREPLHWTAEWIADLEPERLVPSKKHVSGKKKKIFMVIFGQFKKNGQKWFF